MTTNEVRMYIKVYICGLTKSVCIKKKKKKKKNKEETRKKKKISQYIYRQIHFLVD